MQRRGFLGLLGAFAAGAALDPERALWVRGAKTISVPAANLSLDYMEERYFMPAVIAMGNAIKHDFYTTYVLKTLINNVEVLRAIAGDYGELSYMPRGLKIGDTIALRRPPRFIGSL